MVLPTIQSMKANKRFICNGYVDLARNKPGLYITFQDQELYIELGDIMTQSHQVICSVYEHYETQEHDDNMKTFNKLIKKLGPVYEFKNTKGGIFGFIGRKRFKMYSFFNMFYLFEVEHLEESLFKYARNAVRKSKLYYSKLEHYILSIKAKEIGEK